VVRIAMQKDRTQRYGTALELARALSATVGSDPGIAESPPMSQLPNVPSMWMPAQASPTPASHSVVPAAPPTFGAQTPPSMAVAGVVATKGPGGTLASSPGPLVGDGPSKVIAVAMHGTLPSENLPVLIAPVTIQTGQGGARAGIPTWTVVVLVVGALIAGFLLGLATARMM
jgi:hypothetical protein